MSHAREAVLILALCSLLTPATAQPLDLRVTSQGCRVWISDGGPTQTVPPNTDVSNGYQIAVQHPRGSSASSTLTVARAAGEYSLRVDDVTYYNAAASVRPFFNTNLSMRLTAPRSARIDLEARWTLTQAGQFGPSGSVRVNGNILTQAGGLNQGGASTTFVVGPTPTELTLYSDSGIVAGAELHWTLRLTPSQTLACPVTRYGTSCGAELTVGEDLLEPSRPFVDLTVAQQTQPGALVVGLQRVAIPIGPCTLFNEALVVLLVSGRVRFDPPAVPGFAFKLQGAALASGQLVMSDGLDLLCR
jgi:hypothetical protein